ncbi:hypothetical protein LTR85_004814 [Meristemomyces frigidus]|nr:hypothetical protein LTR85_004814 [Meristemomyces frigidus]
MSITVRNPQPLATDALAGSRHQPMPDLALQGQQYHKDFTFRMASEDAEYDSDTSRCVPYPELHTLPVWAPSPPAPAQIAGSRLHRVPDTVNQDQQDGEDSTIRVASEEAEDAIDTSRRSPSPELHTLQVWASSPPAPAQIAAPSICTLTPEQIRPFIPQEGIKLKQLASIFSKEVLPGNVASRAEFVQLVKRVAVNRDEVYYRKAPVPASESTALSSIPRGYRRWGGSTKLAVGGKLTQMSSFDRGESKFCHTVSILDTDAFTLRPLIIAHGALKGRRALVLEPVTTHFRFMDLPPELRQMVYDLLLTEHEGVEVSAYRIDTMPRKLCRASFRARYRSEKVKWVNFIDSTVGDPPSSLSSLLTLNKQVQQEAGTSFYGNNSFKFTSLTDMKFFLESVGDMRRSLRYMSLDTDGYTLSKARATFDLLKEAAGLRTFARFVNDCTKLLKTLHQALEAGDGTAKVTDIIKIHGDVDWPKCRACKDFTSANSLQCARARVCQVRCNELQAHCDKLVADVRALVMKAVGIEEEDSAAT